MHIRSFFCLMVSLITLVPLVHTTVIDITAAAELLSAEEIDYSQELIRALINREDEHVQALLNTLGNTLTPASLKRIIMRVTPEGNTALMWATFHGNSEIVNALFIAIHKAHLSPQEIQSLITYATHNENTALTNAAGYGRTNIIRLLLAQAHKADMPQETIKRMLTHWNKKGITALMQAAQHDHLDTVKTILEEATKNGMSLHEMHAFIVHQSIQGTNALSLAKGKTKEYLTAYLKKLTETLPEVMIKPASQSFTYA